MTLPTQKITISQALTSSFTSNLAKGLNLTAKQEMKARSSALQISGNSTLAKCNPFSIIRYCFEVSRYDFSRDDCVYPIAYGANIQAQVSVRGYKELAMRSGKYKKINASVVYDCDTISRNAITGEISVSFNEDVSKLATAKIVGYYAYAIDLNNELANTIFWTKEQCEQHGRTYSKSYNSVWAKSFDKMALKTVIKQLCNILDTSQEMKELIETDQLVFGDEKGKNEYLDNPQTNQEPSIMEELDTIEAEIDESGEVIE